MTTAPLVERKGQAPGDRLAATRRAMADMAASGGWATDPAAREITLGGIRALAFDPPVPARARLVHLHGGGYRLGCPEAVGRFAAALARDAGIEVICPAYRLAPEHPFPAALNDAARMWEAVCAASDRPPILSGDSAGGGLAASLTALVAAAGPAPTGLVLLSPWLDLSVSADCYDRNAATDPVFSRASATEAAALYLQGVDPLHPHASPLFAGLDAFPPTLICAGDGEVLADDAQRMAAALRAAGRSVTLEMIPGMEHVAVTRGLDLPGSGETLAAIIRFVDTLATDRHDAQRGISGGASDR